LDADTARALEALRLSLDGTRQRVLEEHEKDAEDEGRQQLEAMRAAVVGDMDAAIRAVRESKALEYSRKLATVETQLRRELRSRVEAENSDWASMRRRAEGLLAECADWAGREGTTSAYPAEGTRL